MSWDLEWEVAWVIYSGRMKEAWGKDWPWRSCHFPQTEKERRAYSHNPSAEVDLALASAREVIDRFQITAKNERPR